MSWTIHVTVRRGRQEVLSTSFDQAPLVIGADAACDLVLSHATVSGRHGRVIVSGQRLVYQDTSSNGSFVDGRRIDRQLLGSQGTIEIPPYELELELRLDERRRITLREPLSKLRPIEEAPTEPPSGPPADDEAAAGGPPTADMRDVSAALAARDAERAQRSRATLSGENTRIVSPSSFGHLVASLAVVDGPPKLVGEEFRLPQRSVRIGRSDEADLLIDDGSLSRIHAMLYYVPGKSYNLADLDSTNGSFVNGRRIRQQRLEDGDQVRLGRVELRIRIASSGDPS